MAQPADTDCSADEAHISRSTPGPPARRVGAIQISALIAILALAAALRIHRIGEGSFWFDEQGSIVVASGHLADEVKVPVNRVIDPPSLTDARAGSWLDVWRSPDVNPPLYPLLVRMWRDVFGRGDAATRMLSVAASLAAIVLLFDLGKTLGLATPALWACALMAVAQPQIEYAQEARGYMLWTALGLGASAAAARLIVLGPGLRRTIALVGCAAAMLFVHFFAIFTVAALAIWCAIFLRGKALRATAIAAVAAAIVCLPLAVGLLGHAAFREHDAAWLNEDAAGHVSQTLWRLARLPGSYLAHSNLMFDAFASIGAVTYVLPLFLLRRAQRRQRRTEFAAMTWCFLLICGPTIALGVIDLLRTTGTLEYVRFTLIAAPAYYLFIASLPLRSWLKHVAPAAALIKCLLVLPADYNTQWKGDWRGLGGDVKGVAEPSDAIVFAGSPTSFMTGPAKLYRGVDYYAGPLPCPIVLLNRPADPQVLIHLRAARHVWIVKATDSAPLADYLPGWNFRPVGPQHLFPANLWQAAP